MCVPGPSIFSGGREREGAGQRLPPLRGPCSFQGQTQVVTYSPRDSPGPREEPAAEPCFPQVDSAFP